MRIPVFLAITLFTFLTPATADTDAERAVLARLIHEINATKPLFGEAQSQSDPDARIRFQYGWLRQDLDRIILGIREHLDAPRAQPRTFPPLKGDYRR